MKNDDNSFYTIAEGLVPNIIGTTTAYEQGIRNGQVGKIATALSKAYNAGIDDAAKEVSSHWNDSQTMVNQREQAMRSASVIMGMKK